MTTDGAPREAYADPDFVIVRMTAVRALGSWEAAGCFQRIAWRCERDGQWTATMAEIAEEIGVSERTAKRITKTLRDLGWVESERENPSVSTLTWRVRWAEGQPGTPEEANLALTPEGQTGTDSVTSESAKLALVPGEAKVAPREGQTGTDVKAKVALTPTSKTAKTEERQAVGTPPVRRDLNEGRDDVESLCQHLSQRLTERQVRHTITKAWRDAARLLIDTDGRTEAQVHRMIDWCSKSAFWSPNIHSMPTLREKYDRMREQAMRETGSRDDISTRYHEPDSEDRRQRIADFGG